MMRTVINLLSSEIKVSNNYESIMDKPTITQVVVEREHFRTEAELQRGLSGLQGVFRIFVYY